MNAMFPATPVRKAMPRMVTVPAAISDTREPSTSADDLLRELAFVLHATETVRRSMARPRQPLLA